MCVCAGRKQPYLLPTRAASIMLLLLISIVNNKMLNHSVAMVKETTTMCWAACVAMVIDCCYGGRNCQCLAPFFLDTASCEKHTKPYIH